MSLLTTDQLQNYLPQHPPFLMVDSLAFFDEKKATTSFRILPENILVEDHFFTEAGLLENIAQTCAVHSGYFFASRPVNGNATSETIAPIGFIGAIKDFYLHFLPAENDTLHTTIVIEHQIANASVIKGEVKVNGETAAVCEMKIFLQG